MYRYKLSSTSRAMQQELAMEQVVHFDLKCDNVLLEPLPGVEEAAFWAPASDQLPFQVVLADFGDSCDFHQSEQKFATRWLLHALLSLTIAESVTALQTHNCV